MLEQDIASIVRECTEITGLKAYISEVPKDAEIPSLYFPPPEQETSFDTLDTYVLDNSMFVKVFAKSDRDAQEIALKLIKKLMSKFLEIKIVNFDGSLSSNVFRLDRISQRGIDKGVVQVYIRWKGVYECEIDTVVKARKIYLNIKRGD